MPRRVPARHYSSLGKIPSCHAYVIAGPRHAAVQTLANPKPGPGAVLLRLEGSGVCACGPAAVGRPAAGSSTRSPGGGSPGHEGWGRRSPRLEPE